MKPIEELTFTDDFMFTYILRDKEICKGVLERLLGKKISDVQYPEVQKNFGTFYESKGIRLDVYVEGEDKIYDIEMQNGHYDNLLKRARYYQSLIDGDQLLRGVDYTELPETYVIFICKEDPFNYGDPVYRIEPCMIGLEKRPYDDGTHKVFYNASAYSEEKDPDLCAFLRFVCNQESSDTFTRMLRQRVEEAKVENTFRSYYVEYLSIRDAKKQGQQEERQRIVMQMLEEGLDEKLIEKVSGLSAEEIEALKEKVSVEG